MYRYYSFTNAIIKYKVKNKNKKLNIEFVKELLFELETKRNFIFENVNNLLM